MVLDLVWYTCTDFALECSYGNFKKAFSAAHITVKTGTHSSSGSSFLESAATVMTVSVTHFSNRKLVERFDEGRRALIQAGRSTKEILWVFPLM